MGAIELQRLAHRAALLRQKRETCARVLDSHRDRRIDSSYREYAYGYAPLHSAGLGVHNAAAAVPTTFQKGEKDSSGKKAVPQPAPSADVTARGEQYFMFGPLPTSRGLGGHFDPSTPHMAALPAGLPSPAFEGPCGEATFPGNAEVLLIAMGIS